MPAKPKTDSQVADAARAWRRTYLLVLAVKEARNACECIYETIDAPPRTDDASRAEWFAARVERRHFYPDIAPCWRKYGTNSCGGLNEREHWCAGCLTRNRLHLALTAIKHIRAGRLRRLNYLCAAPEAA